MITLSEIPALPYELGGERPHQIFVLGVTKAKKHKKIVNGKPWPVTRKIVRWHRLASKTNIHPLKVEWLKNNTLDWFVKEKAKGKLRSIKEVVFIDENRNITTLQSWE